ncbi:MAG: T9SS C-terminal target domain-containing protein [Bacteroidetes bacterium]|nr:MAG: T9SS C-terminal target domain-containing protein [Bacteroidota bacterium]
MRRFKNTYLLLLAGLLTAGVLQAREFEGNKKKSPKTNKDLAADCPPSTAIGELALNNVKFWIETGGNMWEDRANGNPFYIVPKIGPDGNDGQNSVLFAGSLWMGGTDPANNLKIAAVRFRQDGNDFWPGPLTNDGTASIEPDICAQYDRFWRTTKQQAQLQALWWERINDGDPENDNDPPFEDGYTIPDSFLEWPGNGDLSLNQDNILGPFFDQNQDGIYDPQAGDYPWYDLTGQLDCRNQFREDPVPLFGDENLFWIFNDKGNIHTESSGEPIGMEIRAQAFEFASDDEINSMTFYNYVLINQGTLTLTNTYFGKWVDFDIGFAGDDYTGCDVQRGLGYGYNGDAFDESGASGPGYGSNPPAVGVDFFEGPFQDADGIDNPLTMNYQNAIDSLGIPYGGIGIGYGDGVVDNERFGMRAFVFHNNSGGPQGDPGIAIDHYQYLQAIWRDGTPMTYGGTGYDPDNPNAQRAFYMFPGDTDPIGWGTEGNPQQSWTEEGEGNVPADRRFIQSAGPFQLEPGNVNNITVGAVFAQSFSGSPFQSVEMVRAADDKAQNLFDNCFEIIEGPDQPDMSISEFDKELILYLTNDNILSNNYREGYHKNDPTIPDIIIEDGEIIEVPEEDKFYNFEGYKVYQLLDASVSPDQLDNPDLARLIFQTDVKNGIGQIINFPFDENIGLSVPTEMVNGADLGIKHSYQITEDAFATTDVNLINYKTYCYMVIAYGYNEYQPYSVGVDGTAKGQPFPFIQSRKSPTGDISLICGIPHKVDAQDGGTVLNSDFGDGIVVTRIEGKGSGGVNNNPMLTQESIDEIMSGEPWKSNNLVYEQEGGGAVEIFVADPLTVKDADFYLGLYIHDEDIDDDSTVWFLVNKELTEDTIWGEKQFNIDNEQLVPLYGISINLSQYILPDNLRSGVVKVHGYTDLISSSIEYADPEKAWLSGVPDAEGPSLWNWIRSGTNITVVGSAVLFPSDYLGQDDEEIYENVLGRTWAPFTMVQRDTIFSPGGDNMAQYIQKTAIGDLMSIDVVFTSDKSKWTRSPVLEAQWNSDLAEGGADEKEFREHPSIDKDGNTNTDEATMNGTQPRGMSYFPGYAIDVTTGERLNIAFSEDSYLVDDNGDDMLWNPTATIETPFGQPIAGGQHYIYIFKNRRSEEPSESKKPREMPSYDYGHFIYGLLDGSIPKRKRIFNAASWVNMPVLDALGPGLLSLEEGLIPTETTVRLRVGQSYGRYATVADISTEGDTIKDQYDYLDSTQYSQNNWNPYYEFSTDGLGASKGQADDAKNFLSEIRVVPNPYYSRSTYENTNLDQQVRLTNLPQTCTISIFNMGGTMVRQISKDNPLTYQDWDMRNHTKVPIASGTYIIHIDAGELGEVILKLFAVMRPADLENF